MKVKCIRNQACLPILTLPIDPKCELSDDNFVYSREWHTINGALQGYSLTPGKDYKVYAIFMMNDMLRYLAFDDQLVPHFFPDVLFECIELTLSMDCGFYRHYTKEATISIIGCEMFEHYENVAGLIDLQSNALSKIIKYKSFLEMWEE